MKGEGEQPPAKRAVPPGEQQPKVIPAPAEPKPDLVESGTIIKGTVVVIPPPSCGCIDTAQY